MAFVHVKDGEVHYDLLSSSPDHPVLTLIHGFLEDSRMWAPLLPFLSDRFNILTVDLPGHGKTSTFNTEHSMEWMADCVAAVLEDLNLQKTALLGHSMGGYVALAFAELHPELLDKFCLFFSTPECDTPEKVIQRGKAAKLVHEHKDSFVRNSIPLLFDPELRETHKSAIETQISQSASMSAKAISASLFGMQKRPDRSRLLHQPPEPNTYQPKSIGIIAGAHDTVIPLERSYHFMEYPEVGFAYLSPHGHMGHITDTEGCAQAIVEWMAL